MGNDGGVIAVKRKFMRHGNTKARNEKLDQDAMRLQRVQTCAISEEPLQEPIVACELGNLYNKQALLEHLLAKTVPERFQHISSLKDVVTCHFSKQKDDATGAYYCPVTMLEFNGKQPFVLVTSCGCVVSERAMKEVQTTECLACGKPMDDGKTIPLLLSDEQYAAGQKRILERKAGEKRLRKEKKQKKQQKTGESATKTVDEEDEQKKKKTKDKKRKAEGDLTSMTGMSAPSTKIAKDAASVIQKEKAKSQVFASLFSKEKSEQKSANDLLMTVGGMRYTLS